MVKWEDYVLYSLMEQCASFNELPLPNNKPEMDKIYSFIELLRKKVKATFMSVSFKKAKLRKLKNRFA